MEIQDFPSEGQELYIHKLHQQHNENIWNHLNNTTEESFNAHWTNDNRSNMRDFIQEILRMQDHYKIFRRTVP